MVSRFAWIGLLLLGGCTDADWQGTLAGFDMTSEPAAVARPVSWSPPAPPAAPLAPAAPASTLCEAAARHDADGNGFDNATRDRVYAQSLAQCQAFYAR